MAKQPAKSSSRGKAKGKSRSEGRGSATAAAVSSEAPPAPPSPAPPPAPAAATLVVRPSYDPDHRVVAITGAYGFLGTELIKLLESDRRYLKVLAIDIRKPELPLGKTLFHKVDLTLPNADAEVAQVLKRDHADTLVHLALLSKPTHNTSWAHELEAIGTMHVLNACAAVRVHKVVLSSLSALYGPQPQNPNYLTESHRRAGLPQSRFFTDKLEAERLARRFGAENRGSVVTILRMANILGRRFNNYVSRYFSLPFAPTMMGYDPLIQLLHEEDAIAALKLAIDADFDGEYNVAADGVLPLSTVLALAGKLTLPLPHLLAAPLAQVLWMTQVLDMPSSWLEFLRHLCVVDTSKIRQEMGFAPRHDIRRIVAEFAGTAPLSIGSPANEGIAEGGLHG
jgi:UDP-glucose 4-epimerase